MRIYPVTYSPARNYQRTNQKNQNQNPSVKTVQEPSFKGWGGVVGTCVGFGAWSLLAALTCLSSIAWTLPFFSGSGGFLGEIFAQKDKPQTDSFGM